MALTTDQNNPCLNETDPASGMQRCYLILPEDQRTNYQRPVRSAYKHKTCGQLTFVAKGIAETFATLPDFYSSTYCGVCRQHFSVAEFVWSDGVKVGS